MVPWKNSLLALLLAICISTYSFGNERVNRATYIQTWKDVAIQNMVEYKIPASITLAQAILESGDGNSELARMSNNHFGIKCHDWKGEKVYYDDDKRGECFRKYDNAGESFADHSKFLQRKRYASLFELKITDYKGWAKGLKKCGYATNPAYARLLIDLIEKNELYKYDREYSKRKDEFLAKTETRESLEETEVKKEKRNRRGGEIPSDIILTSGRTIKVSSNRIKYILAKPGDTPESIAEEMELPVWTVRKYNDFSKNQSLVENEIVYLQPKRLKATENKHTVKAGDTMKSISQRYGVRLKRLYKKNGLTLGQEPNAGDVILLK